MTTLHLLIGFVGCWWWWRWRWYRQRASERRRRCCESKQQKVFHSGDEEEDRIEARGWRRFGRTGESMGRFGTHRGVTFCRSPSVTYGDSLNDLCPSGVFRFYKLQPIHTYFQLSHPALSFFTFSSKPPGGCNQMSPYSVALARPLPAGVIPATERRAGQLKTGKPPLNAGRFALGEGQGTASAAAEQARRCDAFVRCGRNDLSG